MKTHATDVVSLVLGIVFLAIAGIWLLLRSVDITLPSFGWFLAAGLIVAGLAGVVGALRPRGAPTR